MKRPRLQELTDRQQAVAIILAAGLVIAALWFLLLTPMTGRRRALEREIVKIEKQLADRNYLVGREVLERTHAALDRQSQALRDEWLAVAPMVTSFTNAADTTEGRVGKIDYKVALFEVRRRLARKSRDERIRLPPELGMTEAIPDSEDARKLMYQLRTVERLVDSLLDTGIKQVGRIEPLPPKRHDVPGATDVFFEEYPVRIEYRGSLANLYELLGAVLREGNVFILDRIRIEPADPRRDQLDITLVMSALIFARDPVSMLPAGATAPAAVRKGPIGH